MNRTGVAIVTGASRGIGEQIAKRLAAKGHAVIVNYASQADLAESVAAGICAEGGRAIAVQANIAAVDEARALFDRAENEFGPVTILVNNAGVNAPKMMSMDEVDDDTFEHLFGVNARGTFHMLREAARRMPSGGRIVNFSSSVIRLRHPGFSVYAGSKAAIEAFTIILSKELKGREITVNCVAPGPTATEFFFEGKSPKTVRDFAQMSPMERLASPDEVAAVVDFLCSPEAAWVNGQVIAVNGGLV